MQIDLHDQAGDHPPTQLHNTSGAQSSCQPQLESFVVPLTPLIQAFL